MILVSLFLFCRKGNSLNVQRECTQGHSVNTEREHEHKPFCCDSLPLLHFPSVHLWWLVTATLGCWFSAGDRAKPILLIWLTVPIDLITGKVDSATQERSCKLLTYIAQSDTRKTLVNFATREHFTIKCFLLETIKAKARCSLIQYKCGAEERLQPIIENQRTWDQCSVEIW